MTAVTGTRVAYRDLPTEEYAAWLRRAGLDAATAHLVAALDASIAHGDLKANRQDRAPLLGRPATPLTDVVLAATRDRPQPANEARGATAVNCRGEVGRIVA